MGKGKLRNIINNVGNAISEVGEFVADKVTDPVEGAIDIGKDVIQTAGNVVEDPKHTLKHLGQGASEVVSGIVQRNVDRVHDTIDLGRDVVRELSGDKIVRSRYFVRVGHATVTEVGTASGVVSTNRFNFNDFKTGFREFMEGSEGMKRVLVEGDSWCHYPVLGFEIKGSIPRYMFERSKDYDHLAIFSLAQFGETTDQMFSPDYDSSGDFLEERDFQGANNLRNIVTAVQQGKFQAAFLSGGGNDFIGNSKENSWSDLVLTRDEAGGNTQRALKSTFYDYLIDRTMTNYSRALKLILTTDTSIQVFVHGYDNPFATGVGVMEMSDKFGTGPWIVGEPTRDRVLLDGLGWSTNEARAITLQLLGEFRNSLKSLITGRALQNNQGKVLQMLPEEAARIHYVDLEGCAPNVEDWHNEIHVREPGWEQMADRVLEAMRNTGVL